MFIVGNSSKKIILDAIELGAGGMGPFDAHPTSKKGIIAI
jgi:hypothetical protein